MNAPRSFDGELPVGFDLAAVEWDRLIGGPSFDYPIDYAVAVAAADVPAGKLDLLVQWAPNAYCHFHRHCGTTKAVVIAGEQHLLEARVLETVHKIRQAGFRGSVPDGEVHMERAGPAGLVMLFSIQAPASGIAFDVLDRDGTVIAAPTVEDFVARRLATKAA